MNDQEDAEAATQRCSWEKVFWKYAANLLENTHAEVWFQIKLYSNFFEITLRHGCSVNLLLIFRTPFPRNTSELLPLKMLQYFSFCYPDSFTMKHWWISTVFLSEITWDLQPIYIHNNLLTNFQYLTTFSPWFIEYLSRYAHNVCSDVFLPQIFELITEQLCY